jgi:hypothetical protein
MSRQEQGFDVNPAWVFSSGHALVFLAVGLVLLFPTGCAFRVEKNPPVVNTSSIGFDQVRTSVIAPSCLGCHSSREPKLTSYDEVKAALPALRKVLESRSMPPGAPLADDDRALFSSWIDGGAPEHGIVVSAPSLEQRPVTFARLKEKLLAPACLTCHRAGNADGLTDYSTAQAVRDSVGTFYYLTNIDPQMPPAPAVVSREQKDLLSAWVVDGMKD